MKLGMCFSLFMTCIVQLNWAQTGAERLQQYQQTLRTVHTVGYNVQRIDTFGNGSVWNHAGQVLMQRNPTSKILASSFVASRPDKALSYHYNGNVGFALDDKAKTFEIEKDPYEPSVLGSPTGQMLSEELLTIDPSYQTVTYSATPQGGVFHLQYPDQPNVDVLDRHTYLLLDAATGLPRVIKTTQVRGGGKWTTIKTISNLRVNAPTDVDTLQKQAFLTTYTPIVTAPLAVSTPSMRGQIAPAFKLASFDKQLVNLTAYRGKVVLLDFWATTCSPCIGSMPTIQQMQNQYKKQGLVVLGVLLNDESTEKAQGILRRQRATYTNLLGSKAVASAYHIESFPRYIVIGKDGKIALDQVGGPHMEQVEAAIKSALDK
ncbi:TlpA family protein disulfide reductase [Hymenobacter sp. BT186]|uniref:TlpA family protein disulfide reductase n=1 Tax=Hymenobacter telluris TaxID=2816474 RepID=A0A939JB14_9BACT|nr:TlpA disulfide reductase family protein [Hymenobacter telluris]MBO0358676.1 TlpA family protein disulfide reductase [Hymenobacter telluris]MBW3374702.1 TlpA family protein disulfide reductase [Hymenobacter norwichensis]